MKAGILEGSLVSDLCGSDIVAESALLCEFLLQRRLGLSMLTIA